MTCWLMQLKIEKTSGLGNLLECLLQSWYCILVFNIPLDTPTPVIPETIYGSDDPTNSVIALKDDG